MNRRTFLAASTSLGAVALGASRALAATVAEGPFEITRTQAEWRAMLSETQYAVMREGATEPPYSSPLNDEDRRGTFHCRGCDLPLYASDTKYDSGTGWPSFYEALPDAIGTMEDRTLLFLVRTECHCRRCGSHLGHIFDDGPQPTGKRHCLNGVSLVFRPAA
ncbi:peptide-methionine (R)-S-oxide reductase MsrB [Roseibacterium sp. SDUM158017]|uniref:peptide-methionine (R)-S-oxide reductase MsrB n=1 Tax=Roseicyclus salinarum TaxID=3036773 RepID=UPI0024154C09|nr:peptide-methionine (R)-S-oxide reductase MsrB [Roseibacterium sp. SDUM158017]MDG4647583.1 peptide-methionine (R)-S-oxide reductase MsrB [Roseibacterium sp. SDUM158017]